MREIKVNEATFQKHASKLDSKSAGSYLPLKGGNMAYSRANSINQLRSALIDLVDVVEDFQAVTKQDAGRLKKMGTYLCETRSSDGTENKSAGGAIDGQHAQPVRTATTTSEKSAGCFTR